MTVRRDERGVEPVERRERDLVRIERRLKGLPGSRNRGGVNA